MTSTRRELDPELTILGGRDLVGLVGRLLRERSWDALTSLFDAIAAKEGIAYVSLVDLDTATRLLAESLAEIVPPKKPNAALADELRALRISAAEALLSRSIRPAVGEIERRILGRAAALLSDGGDHRRAALAHEELGDDVRAASAWGALGDLERMETALARDERRESARRTAVDAMRRFEALMTGGERRQAIGVAALVSGVEEAATARQLATRIESRLVRGRALTVRAPGGRVLRIAGLPACLGRDPSAEVPMRDPGVSRRHALVRSVPGNPETPGGHSLHVEDAGSRGGVLIGGARLDRPLPLRGTGEIALGMGSTLRFVADDGCVSFEGLGRARSGPACPGRRRTDRAFEGLPGSGRAVGRVFVGVCPPAPARGRGGSGRRPFHRPRMRPAFRRRHRAVGAAVLSPGGGMSPSAPNRLLDEADRAERVGDLVAAAVALRNYLEHRPDDRPARLRFARLLIATGDRPAARQALAPFDLLDPDDPTGREATRKLAELDEAEGAVLSAAERWERILADDIDDPQARAHLAMLRPEITSPPVDASQTLVSPEGVEVSRYRLMRELGRGATSTVYLARDGALELDLALKVLHPQLVGSGRSDACRRFFAEARMAAAIRHPGVVAIYDVDEGARALAMEWIPGGTVRERLRSCGGTLPPAELEATARSLLATLAHVHARGTVHGDLKPSNLLLRRPGEIVLADFGTAELTIEARARSTGGALRAGIGVVSPPGGTPLYLAPEQFKGAPASPATDLYAVGAILWEATCGRPLRSHADLMRGAQPQSLPPTPAPSCPPAARPGPTSSSRCWTPIHRASTDRVREGGLRPPGSSRGLRELRQGPVLSRY